MQRAACWNKHWRHLLINAGEGKKLPLTFVLLGSGKGGSRVPCSFPLSLSLSARYAAMWAVLMLTPNSRHSPGTP